MFRRWFKKTKKHATSAPAAIYPQVLPLDPADVMWAGLRVPAQDAAYSAQQLYGAAASAPGPTPTQGGVPSASATIADVTDILPIPTEPADEDTIATVNTGVSGPVGLLSSALDEMRLQRTKFMGVYDLSTAVDRRYGGQGVVQFATAKSELVAIKFFLDPSAYEQEERIYDDDVLSEVMPARMDSSDNSNGAVTGPGGYRFPPFIILERGESLSDFSSRIRSMGGHVGTPTAVHALVLISQRLAFLHLNNWVHGDLKPGNILCMPQSFGWALIDFGCCYPTGTVKPLAFSLHYAAPETIKAFEDGETTATASPASDVFALGVIAYELLTGTRVFPRDVSRQSVFNALTGRAKLPWEKLAPDSPELQSLVYFRSSVMECLSRDPSMRPSSDALARNWGSVFESKTQHARQQAPSLPSLQAECVSDSSGGEDAMVRVHTLPSHTTAGTVPAGAEHQQPSNVQQPGSSSLGRLVQTVSTPEAGSTGLPTHEAHAQPHSVTELAADAASTGLVVHFDRNASMQSQGPVGARPAHPDAPESSYVPQTAYIQHSGHLQTPGSLSCTPATAPIQQSGHPQAPGSVSYPHQTATIQQGGHAQAPSSASYPHQTAPIQQSGHPQAPSSVSYPYQTAPIQQSGHPQAPVNPLPSSLLSGIAQQTSGSVQPGASHPKPPVPQAGLAAGVGVLQAASLASTTEDTAQSQQPPPQPTGLWAVRRASTGDTSQSQKPPPEPVGLWAKRPSA